MEHLTLSDIARMFEVTPQRASAIVAKKGFPKPVIDLPRRRVWRKPTVERWAQTHR